jgi:hypothetical protein
MRVLVRILHTREDLVDVETRQVIQLPVGGLVYPGAKLLVPKSYLSPEEVKPD